MKALLQHNHGHTFIAKSDSNHWIPVDTGEKSGGSGAANDPFQLFIIAATGCMAIDVVDILRKSRKEIAHFEIETEAIRAESIPRVLRSIHFRVRLSGEGFSGKQVQRAIELSLTKYCSVSLSIDRAVKFTAQCTLNGIECDLWEINRDAIFRM